MPKLKITSMCNLKINYDLILDILYTLFILSNNDFFLLHRYTCFICSVRKYLGKYYLITFIET